MWLIVLMVCWTLTAMFFGTAVIAARLVSPTRLAALLGPARAAAQVDAFLEHSDECARCSLGYRQLSIVAFVLTLFAYVNAHSSGVAAWIWFWAICLPWLSIFGVAVPWAWARHAGDAFLARTLSVLEMIRVVSRPLLFTQEFVGEIIRRLAGAPHEDDPEFDEVEREILDAVHHGATRGAVDAAEREMIRSVMFLDETSVGEIMTPRTDIISIHAEATHAEVLELARVDGHSRIPVYEGTIDHVVGILYARDLLGVDPKNYSLAKLMRPVTFVPETKDLASLLREFQANRVHIAIVLDEYGGTAGLVTIEDILEELVGDIDDEHDEPPVSAIERIDDVTADVDARLRVDEINEELDLSLPEDEAYDTIGGFVLSKFGRIPRESESFVEGNLQIEVVEAVDRAVNRLRIRRLAPADED